MTQFQIEEKDTEAVTVKVHEWSYMQERRRAVRGNGRSKLYKDFVEIVPEGKAAEFRIPQGVKRESARTGILAAAKALGVTVQTTEVGVPEGVILVGKPPAEQAA